MAVTLYVGPLIPVRISMSPTSPAWNYQKGHHFEAQPHDSRVTFSLVFLREHSGEFLRCWVCRPPVPGAICHPSSCPDTQLYTSLGAGWKLTSSRPLRLPFLHSKSSADTDPAFNSPKYNSGLTQLLRETFTCLLKVAPPGVHSSKSQPQTFPVPLG